MAGFTNFVSRLNYTPFINWNHGSCHMDYIADVMCITTPSYNSTGLTVMYSLMMYISKD